MLSADRHQVVESPEAQQPAQIQPRFRATEGSGPLYRLLASCFGRRSKRRVDIHGPITLNTHLQRDGQTMADFRPPALTNPPPTVQPVCVARVSPSSSLNAQPVCETPISLLNDNSVGRPPRMQFQMTQMGGSSKPLKSTSLGSLASTSLGSLWSTKSRGSPSPTFDDINGISFFFNDLSSVYSPLPPPYSTLYVHSA